MIKMCHLASSFPIPLPCRVCFVQRVARTQLGWGSAHLASTALRVPVWPVLSGPTVLVRGTETPCLVLLESSTLWFPRQRARYVRGGIYVQDSAASIQQSAPQGWSAAGRALHHQINDALQVIVHRVILCAENLLEREITFRVELGGSVDLFELKM